MSPKLFTATDVERAARLAAQSAADAVQRWAENSSADEGNIVERAVGHAVTVVADDHQPFYSEEDVLHILQFVLEKENVTAEFEDAVATALRR